MKKGSKVKIPHELCKSNDPEDSREECDHYYIYQRTNTVDFLGVRESLKIGIIINLSKR